MSEHEHVYDKHVIESMYIIHWYSICMLTISLLGMIAFVNFNAGKSRQFIFLYSKDNVIHIKYRVLCTIKSKWNSW